MAGATRPKRRALQNSLLVWWDKYINNHNSLFPAHQSQTKYFRKTFRQMFLWPHQLQKTNDKKSNLCCMKNVNGWTDANMKTVRANFLSRLHRTWVWWTRTKKRKLNRFSVQNLETIVGKKKKKKNKEKRKKKKENGKMNLSCTNWRKLFWNCILQNGVPSLGVL